MEYIPDDFYNIDCKAVKANKFCFICIGRYICSDYANYMIVQLWGTRGDQICSSRENKHKKPEELSETICIVPLTKLHFLCNTDRTDEKKAGRAENNSQIDQDRWLLAFGYN